MLKLLKDLLLFSYFMIYVAMFSYAMITKCCVIYENCISIRIIISIIITYLFIYDTEIWIIWFYLCFVVYALRLIKSSNANATIANFNIRWIIKVPVFSLLYWIMTLKISWIFFLRNTSKYLCFWMRSCVICINKIHACILHFQRK